jgi:hypothetical protein
MVGYYCDKSFETLKKVVCNVVQFPDYGTKQKNNAANYLHREYNEQKLLTEWERVLVSL